MRAAVTEDPQAAWTVVRRLLATYMEMPAYAQMFRAAGFESEVSAIRGAWAASWGGAAASAASRNFVQAMAAVGPADACRAELARYHDAGADVVAAYPFPFGDDAASSMRATIEALAP